MESWDTIIIGAGPAGLTAGIYAGRSGMKTLVLEEKMSGGETAIAPWIENYPGFDSISGPDLVMKMVTHCQKFGAQINELEKVVSLDPKGQKKVVKTNKTTYSTPAIIIATGTHHRRLNVPGEERFQGKGVSYCAMCDGPFFKSKKVIVVGGGNSAAISARYLSGVGAEVELLHRRSQLRAEAAYLDDLKRENVKFRWNSEVKEIKGETIVNSVVVHNNKTGELNELNVDGLFVQIGETPNTQFVEKAGIEVDKKGYIVVDTRQRTNVPGVFAAGDVTVKPVKQIGTAVGEAIIAATEAFGYVNRPYYYK